MRLAIPSALDELEGWPSLLRDGVALGWLFLATGAVYILLVMGPLTTLEPAQEAVLRLFVLPSLPLAALVCLLWMRDLATAFLHMPFLLVFLVLMWSSVAWSLDPGVSLRRAMLLTAYTILAVWLTIAYRPGDLLARLAWLSLTISILAAIFAVALPHLAFHELEGQMLLRGVFSHKNVMGQHLGFSAILMVVAWQQRLIPRWASGLGLVLCVVLAVPTGSATALIIMAGLAVIRVFAAILAFPGRQAAVLLALAVAAGCFVALAAILGAEQIFALLGRDPTLSGRVPLWHFVWQQIGHRPWLGYGFAVFFDIDWVEAYTMEAMVWSIPNAHNGYLELWLGMGVAAPILITLFLALGLGRAVARLSREATPAALFTIYFIPIYLLRNIVESDLAEPSQISWVLAVIATAMTLRSAESRRGPVHD